MPYILSSSQIALLENTITSNTNHPYADFYRALADIGENALNNGEDVEEAAIIWLRGAADVNENVGTESAFIRAYNSEQSLLRFGQQITDSQMNTISDTIADRVFNELKFGTQNIPALQFPTLEQVAESDAQPAAEALFQGDAGGWAGNPLFLALGYDNTFNSNIIENTQDTYDAWAMISVATKTGGWDDFGAGVYQLAQYPQAYSIITNSITNLNTFIDTAYGDISTITPTLWLPSTSEIQGKIVLGLVSQSDTFTENDATPGPLDAMSILHSSGGNDSFEGSWGSVLIDGGEDYDIISYHDISAKYGQTTDLTVTIIDKTSDVNFSASVQGGPMNALLYNIEEITLGQGNDIVHISNLTEGLISLQKIDGSTQSINGSDTIDLSTLSNTGVFLDLTQNILHSSEDNTNQLEVLGFEKFVGSSYSDEIIGNTFGNNIIKGGGGDDKLYAKGGVVQFDGGAGNDTISFEQSGVGITFNMNTGIHTGFAQYATYTNIENFEFTYGDDDITGNDSSNTFYGLNGDDTIDGGKGDDVLYGGNHNDTIITGEGQDLVYGGAGNDFIDAKTSLSTDQAEIYGGSGNDTIKGSKGSDSLYGDEGHDDIVGSVGQDQIFGGNDDDIINSQGSNDHVYGGLGIDNINGGSGDDHLYGDENADTLEGHTGIDNIYGGDGIDLLYGGNDSDKLYGGSGNDELDDDHGNDELYGGIGNDTLYGGLWADTLEGGADNDNLYGGHSNDSLIGDEGRDHLFGGDGNDQMTGGLGDDVFIFRANEGSDTVFDFNRNEGDKVLINTYNETNGAFTTSGNSNTTIFTLTWDGGSSTLTVHGMEYDPLNSFFDWGTTFL